MPKYASGKYAKAISDRSGMEFPYKEMVKEWNGSFVHVSEFEPKQPQLEPKPMSADAISLANIRPSREANPVAGMIPEDGFKTYEAGSRIINVFSPGHGLTSSTTYRFRGAPTTSAGGNVFKYSNPQDFDGILGSNIAKAAGYSITIGLYKDDAVVSTDYTTTNYFHFTVDTNTATLGGVKGGGYGCSIGPVTIEA